MDEIQKKTHFVSVTGIIKKDNKYLICKRSPNEKAFPEKWCVPGGKIEVEDFIALAKDTSSHWLDIFEKTLRKEIFEETGLIIKNIGYVSNLAFIRPNGFSTLIVSLFADHESGEVILKEDELTEHAWVSLEEAKNYDLIENIFEQIEKVHSTANLKQDFQNKKTSVQEYQEACLRTVKEFENETRKILTWGLGISGEAGDVAGCIKKTFIHKNDVTAGIRENLGDTMWYIANICNFFNWDLQDILEENTNKLKKRYPQGFTYHDAKRGRKDWGEEKDIKPV